ncbi:MAG: serine hydrolase domain-containing protein [Acidobacteriota bacterium]
MSVLLERAVRAGLSPGWVGLAQGAGAAGLVWCSGRSGVGGEPVQPDLRYDLASLTKPLATATLLLLAMRDGLELDEQVGALLPELAASSWREVTVGQCASHTAGFPAWAPLYALAEASREGYLRALAGITPVAAPGEKVVYSCLGYIALGIALERAASTDLKSLFCELVAAPLGLDEELGYAPLAGTPTAAGQRRPLIEEGLLAARGLSAAPPPPPDGATGCDDGNARGLGGMAGNAGLFGTAAAVARLCAEFLPGGGELLGAAEAELATRCLTPGLEQARALGWQLAATAGCSAGPALPPEAFGHTGFSGTSAWADPARRQVLVLLGNRLHPGGGLPDLHPLRRRFNNLAARACLQPS